MTEQSPNLKEIILEYTLENWTDDIISMYELSEQTEYSAVRLGSKVRELDGIFEWGVSPRVPWIPDWVSMNDVERKLREYDNTCPHCDGCGSPKQYVVGYAPAGEPSMWVCPNEGCGYD